ncbi:MAG: hypothetical protein AB3N34_01470 [Lettuce witches'-broom phytoplasma]
MMYPSMFVTQNKLSGTQLTFVIIVSIMTLGCGWFVLYPIFKTFAYNRDIQIQTNLKYQMGHEIYNLQKEIEQIEEEIKQLKEQQMLRSLKK